jgi:negative regulator of sigma E activity
MMDVLIARYFDGDLTDGEARELLEAAESNPKLENELRAYERLLSAAKMLPPPRPSAGFAERVMETVRAESYSIERFARTADREKEHPRAFPRRPSLAAGFGLLRRRWVPAAVAAAVVVVVAFMGGMWLGRGEIRPSARAPEMGVAAIASGTESGLRYVRLVYAPHDPSIENVSVAGSFNGWDPTSTPLEREDGVFSTILVLPAGSYEYMFVENGNRWVTDPLAVSKRDDGFGATNAVLDVGI